MRPAVWLQHPCQTLPHAVSRQKTSATDLQTPEWRPYIIISSTAPLLTLPQLMSPGLKRAREPYRLRNAFTGLGLGLLAFGIYSYAIGAVKQDVFDDVDEEAKALARTGTLSRSPSQPPKPPPIPLTQDQEKRIMERAFSAALDAGRSSPAEDHIAPNSTASSQQKPGQGTGLYKLKRWFGME